MYRNDSQLTVEIKIVIFESVSDRRHAKWTMIVKLQPSRGRFSIFDLKLWSYCTEPHQNFTLCIPHY